MTIFRNPHSKTHPIAFQSFQGMSSPLDSRSHIGSFGGMAFEEDGGSSWPHRWACRRPSWKPGNGGLTVNGERSWWYRVGGAFLPIRLVTLWGSSVFLWLVSEELLNTFHTQNICFKVRAMYKLKNYLLKFSTCTANDY